MLALAIFSVIVALIIILIKPKLGTLIIWIVLFAYPHGWWANNQFLPLNMGADDILCVFLFLAVLIRRNLLGGINYRFNYAFWVLTAFTIITIISVYAGSQESTASDFSLYLKDILKAGIYWALFYAIIHCIDNKRDLKIQLTMFSIAAAIGGLIVIGQYFWPERMGIFLAPVTVERGGLALETRTSGAFMNPNVAACVLVSSMALVAMTLRFQVKLSSKIIVCSFVIVLLIALLMTRSRTGLLALVGTFGLMGILGRNKKVAWFFVLAGLFVAISFPQARNLFLQRVDFIYNPTTGAYEKNVAGRFETWRSYFETATIKDYLLGQGSRQGIVQNEMESHSTYVSMPTVYGVGGVIWAVFTFYLFLRYYIYLKKSYDPFIRIVSAGCMWSLTAWCIFSLASDAISTQYSRYLFFYLIVLLDRTYIIAIQEQQLLAYEQQGYMESSQLDTYIPQAY